MSAQTESQITDINQNVSPKKSNNDSDTLSASTSSSEKSESSTSVKSSDSGISTKYKPSKKYDRDLKNETKTSSDAGSSADSDPSRISLPDIYRQIGTLIVTEKERKLRPTATKHPLSEEQLLQFQEMIFQKAKLKKRRRSNDGDDIVPPSKPKLYKKVFVVEDIREMAIDSYGEDHYLVKWQDWPEETNTWEPGLHLDNCDEIIRKFRRRLKKGSEYETARKYQLQFLRNFSDKLFDATSTAPRIEVVNDIDLTTPNDDFIYQRKLEYPKNRELISISCDCDECGEECPCATMDGHKLAYKEDGSLRIRTGNPIYECSAGCKCRDAHPPCRNRQVQKGRTARMQLFKTPNGRGWGIRTLDHIKRNTFVLEYVGEVIDFAEAELRGKIYDVRGRTYLFDMDFFQKPAEYTIDAMKMGNEARFFNHACNPNLFSMCVWWDSVDPFLHHVAFFAKQDIPAGRELCINYRNAGLTRVPGTRTDDTEVALDAEGNPISEPIVSALPGAPPEEQVKTPCRCSKNCTEDLF